MTANDSHTGNPANILHSEREYPSRLKSKKHEDLLPRLDDSVWDQFVKDLGDVSTNTKRDDKSDPHLQIPKSGGKSFDLEIQKDTMCDATKFSVAIIPGQDPTKSWTPVYGKTYGEVAQAMHGASEEDIAKASKALIDTALAMAKPAFGHLSGEKGCTAVLPAPKKRDVPDANLGNTQNSVEKKLEAARYWILLYVDTGLLGADDPGRRVSFDGPADQGNPAATQARARVHAYIIVMCVFTIIESFQEMLGQKKFGEVIALKVIHPLVNVLFDALQRIYAEIKKDGNEGNDDDLQELKRGAPVVDCVHVNDFKWFLQNIGNITQQEKNEIEPKGKPVCAAPPKL